MHITSLYYNKQKQKEKQLKPVKKCKKNTLREIYSRKISEENKVKFINKIKTIKLANVDFSPQNDNNSLFSKTNDSDMNCINNSTNNNKVSYIDVLKTKIIERLSKQELFDNNYDDNQRIFKLNDTINNNDIFKWNEHNVLNDINLFNLNTLDKAIIANDYPRRLMNYYNQVKLNNILNSNNNNEIENIECNKNKSKHNYNEDKVVIDYENAINLSFNNSPVKTVDTIKDIKSFNGNEHEDILQIKPKRLSKSNNQKSLSSNKKSILSIDKMDLTNSHSSLKRINSKDTLSEIIIRSFDTNSFTNSSDSLEELLD